jgi:nitrogen fixation/metabolism regulation signal transduction histidine kinase
VGGGKMAGTYFKELSYLRTVLDAIPSPVLVLDYDLKVHDANLCASHMIHNEKKGPRRPLCGEVLQCIHEKESLGGCGTADFCADCVIRKAIDKSKEGRKVFRETYNMHLQKDDEIRYVNYLITASPFVFEERPLVLVIIEDITELVTLQKTLPICARCKKIRKADRYWENVESYLNTHTGLQFTHGICPECADELYPEYDFGQET